MPRLGTLLSAAILIWTVPHAPLFAGQTVCGDALLEEALSTLENWRKGDTKAERWKSELTSRGVTPPTYEEIKGVDRLRPYPIMSNRRFLACPYIPSPERAMREAIEISLEPSSKLIESLVRYVNQPWMATEVVMLTQAYLLHAFPAAMTNEFMEDHIEVDIDLVEDRIWIIRAVAEYDRLKTAHFLGQVKLSSAELEALSTTPAEEPMHQSFDPKQDPIRLAIRAAISKQLTQGEAPH